MNTGMLVRLNSGGPPMTITGTQGEDFVVCHWFAGSDLRLGVFPAQAITVEES